MPWAWPRATRSGSTPLTPRGGAGRRRRDGACVLLLRWGGRVVAIDLPNPQARGNDSSPGPGRAAAHRSPGPGRGADVDGRPGGRHRWHRPDPQDAGGARPARAVEGRWCWGTTSMPTGACTCGCRWPPMRWPSGWRIGPTRMLAYSATPTDAFAVPWSDVESPTTLAPPHQGRAGAVAPGRDVREELPHTVTAQDGTQYGIADRPVPQQGPNYALAKRLQRWRAVVARSAGQRVSLNVAPSTRTRSVVKNRALATAYAGAHRFGIRVFEASTANTLMAAMLVHDLRNPESAANPDVSWATRWTSSVRRQPRRAVGPPGTSRASVLGFMRPPWDVRVARLAPTARRWDAAPAAQQVRLPSRIIAGWAPVASPPPVPIRWPSRLPDAPASQGDRSHEQHRRDEGTPRVDMRMPPAHQHRCLLMIPPLADIHPTTWVHPQSGGGVPEASQARQHQHTQDDEVHGGDGPPPPNIIMPAKMMIPTTSSIPTTVPGVMERLGRPAAASSGAIRAAGSLGRWSAADRTRRQTTSPDSHPEQEHDPGGWWRGRRSGTNTAPRQRSETAAAAAP